jgi:hypothetical protein
MNTCAQAKNGLKRASGISAIEIEKESALLKKAQALSPAQAARKKRMLALATDYRSDGREL